MPDEFRAEAVVAAMPQDGHARRRARAAAARRHRPRGHRRADCATPARIVTDVVAYRTVLDEAQRDGEPDIYRMLLDGRIDVVTFTSPSAVRNFSEIYGAEQTTDLLEEHGRGRHRAGDRGRRHAARHRRHRRADRRTRSRRWSTPSPRTVAATRGRRHAARSRSVRLRAGLRGKIRTMAVTTRTTLSLTRRPRRLRRTEAIRSLVRETRLTPDCFIYPLFVCEGEGVRREVGSMPGVFQLSVDEAVKEAAAAKARRRAGGACCSACPREGRRPARWPPIPRRRCRPRCAR